MCGGSPPHTRHLADLELRRSGRLAQFSTHHPCGITPRAGKHAQNATKENNVQRLKELDETRSAEIYSNPCPPEFDPDAIRQLLDWIGRNGTARGVWIDVQVDASTGSDISRDRDLWLAAAACMDRARLLGQCDDDGAAAWELADFLRRFDAAHETWGGAVGPEDRRLQTMISTHDAGSRYVAQEWRAAHHDA